MTVPSEANCYCGAQPRGGGGGVLGAHLWGHASEAYEVMNFLHLKIQRFCNVLYNFLQLQPPHFRNVFALVANALYSKG